MDRRRIFVLGLIMAFAAALAAAETPDTQSLALTGGLIRTETDAGEFIGTVLIREGKISALGPTVDLPAGAKTIDVSKCVITPGLIDSHGMLGLNPAAAAEGGREATLNILDAVDPYSDDWRDAARQGITAVYVQPASSGNLGGSGAVLRVCAGDCADSIALKAPAGVQMVLGSAPQAPVQTANPIPDFGGRRGGPIQTPPAQPEAPPAANSLTRFSQYEQLKGQFDTAKKYGESKPTRREAPKELLARAVKGEIPVRIEVNHEDDLKNAQRLATDFGLRPIYERIERARLIPDEFRTARAALIVGPFAGGQASGEVRKLALDGRKFAIGTFGSEPRATCSLRFHAAAAAASGYPRDRVLRSMTRDAADLLGVGDKLGTIAVGRPADLAVFAGDPLDPSASVRLTISQGKITHEASATEIAPSPMADRPQLPAKFPQAFVLRTTRLLTSAGAFAPGELFVVNGRLTGRDANSTSLPVIDVGDAPVTPGFVAGHIAVPGETSPDADAAQLRATDGLAPDDGKLRSCRDAGFLTALAAPGSTNVLAGTAGAVRINEGIDVRDAGLKLVLTAAARSSDRFPISLAGQIQLIDARLRGVPPETNQFLPAAVEAGLFAQREQAMQALRDRRMTAFVEAQTRAEVRAALRLIAEHKLRGVLVMPREVADLNEEIRQAGIPVIIGTARPQDAERVTNGYVSLAKAGVPLAFGGDPADMRATAAWLVNNGLPRTIAARALLGQPAEAFGLPAGTGRLQPGDAADFAIWTGDPLDTSSRPIAVVVHGQRVAASSSEDAPKTDGRRPATAPTPPRRRGR